jgi:hypothetical protein
MRPHQPRRGGRPAPQAPIPAAARASAPYHFVPVEPESAVLDGLTPHDVLDVEARYSGELHCTLTTLTPLLAANDQYELEQARKDLRQQVEAVIAGRFPGRRLPGAIASDKKILEPLTDSDPAAVEPGPVLIAGAAPKGMLRQSLAALLAAPMERVMERTSSYRPNVKTLTRKHDRFRTALPALVIYGGGWKGPTDPNPVRLLVLRNLRSVCYVHPDALPHLPPRVQALLGEDTPTHQARYADAHQRNALRLSNSEARALQGVGLSMTNILKPNGPRRPGELEGWLPIVNLNGIDLVGELNGRFHKLNPELAQQLSTKSPRGYPLLFLNLQDSREVTVEDAVLLGGDALFDPLTGDGKSPGYRWNASVAVEVLESLDRHGFLGVRGVQPALDGREHHPLAVVEERHLGLGKGRYVRVVLRRHDLSPLDPCREPPVTNTSDTRKSYPSSVGAGCLRQWVAVHRGRTALEARNSPAEQVIGRVKPRALSRGSAVSPGGLEPSPCPAPTSTSWCRGELPWPPPTTRRAAPASTGSSAGSGITVSMRRFRPTRGSTNCRPARSADCCRTRSRPGRSPSTASAIG